MAGLNLTERFGSPVTGFLTFPSQLDTQPLEGRDHTFPHFVPALVADRGHEGTLCVSPQKKTQWLNDSGK